MIRVLLLLIIISVVSCKSKEHKFDTTTYEKAKESLEDKEKKSPEQFLAVTSSDKKNLIGQTVIRGNIHNRASVCTYKDVEVKISFISKTGVVLEEDKETVYEIIPPNNSVKFKSKYFAPKGTDDVRLTVTNAKVQEK